LTRLGDHLRSNAIAYVCLVLLMGGTAVAATKLPRNSVTSKTIRNGQVKASDLGRGSVNAKAIAPSAVGGSAIADNSVTGADVDESSLTGVLRCPANLTQTGDVCFEQENRSGNWQAAVRACGDAGLRLPSLPETYLFVKAIPNPVSDFSFWAADDVGSTASILSKSPTGIITFGVQTKTANLSYRCVTSPTG
jgi:hypothetical protein